MGKKLATRNSQLATPHHSIRLRHPWQCETCGESALWSRKFNWPAELTPDEVVHLVIEAYSLPTAISLNDVPLDVVASGRYEVNDLLGGHNRLTIGAASADNEACPFEVRLEISSVSQDS